MGDVFLDFIKINLTKKKTMKNRKHVYKLAKELGLNMISQNKQPLQFHLKKKHGISLQQKRDWFTAYIAQIKKGVNIRQHMMSKCGVFRMPPN